MIATERKKLSIRKNDQVQVIAGRDKGKVGKVVRVDLKTGRIVVEKVNMVKRHLRPSQQYPQGGILEKELPLDYSNVLLHCSKCNRGVRHSHKEMGQASKESKDTKSTEKKGKSKSTDEGRFTKIRVCKRCGESLEGDLRR